MVDRVVPFDIFAAKECPWFRPYYSTNNGYGCAHPAQEETELVAIPAIGEDFSNDGVDEPGPTCLVEEGRCFRFSCPLGYELSPEDEPADAAVLKAHGFNPKHCSNGYWMLIPEGFSGVDGGAYATD